MAETKRNLDADLALCNAAFDDCGRAYVWEVTGNEAGLQYSVDVDTDYGQELVAYTEIETYARFIAEARTGWPHAIERAITAEKEVEELRILIRLRNESSAFKAAELRREGDLRIEAEVEIERLRKLVDELSRKVPVTFEQAAEIMHQEREKRGGGR